VPVGSLLKAWRGEGNAEKASCMAEKGNRRGKIRYLYFFFGRDEENEDSDVVVPQAGKRRNTENQSEDR